MSVHRFLAFDLGAESGRGVVGTLDGGELTRSKACDRTGPVEVVMSADQRIRWK